MSEKFEVQSPDDVHPLAGGATIYNEVRGACSEENSTEVDGATIHPALSEVKIKFWTAPEGERAGKTAVNVIHQGSTNVWADRLSNWVFNNVDEATEWIRKTAEKDQSPA